MSVLCLYIIVSILCFKDRIGHGPMVKGTEKCFPYQDHDLWTVVILPLLGAVGLPQLISLLVNWPGLLLPLTFLLLFETLETLLAP